MNRIAIYSIALAVIIGFTIAEIVEIALLFFRSRKCNYRIAVKNSNKKYAWDISIIVVCIFAFFWRRNEFYAYYDFSEIVEYYISTSLYLLISLFMLIRFIFIRNAYITENGIIGAIFSHHKNDARYSIKRIGGETLLKLYTNSADPDVTYAIKRNNERKALALIKKLYPEYNGEPDMKRNLHGRRHTFFYIGCGLVCTSALAAWYFAEMPVVFVGDKIVKTDSEYALFDYMGMYRIPPTNVIPPIKIDAFNDSDTPEFDYSEIQNSEKITSNDLYMLKKMPNLKQLCLTDNYIYDFTEIGQLTKLEGLYFNCYDKEMQKHIDYTPLKNLVELKYFMGISMKNFDDFSIFENMDKLENVVLSDIDITSENMEILCKKERLKGLSFLLCNFEDYSALNMCKDLSYLDISNTNITNLSFCQNMPYLETLYTKNLTELESYTDIGCCTNLKRLNISNSNITDISFLAGLNKLESIYMDKVSADDYSVLTELASLEYLKVSNTDDIPKEIINKLTQNGVLISD